MKPTIADIIELRCAEARRIVSDPQLCTEKPSLRDVAWITLRQHRRDTARPVPAVRDGDRPGGDAA